MSGSVSINANCSWATGRASSSRNSRQRQEPLQDAQAFRAALLVKLFRPSPRPLAEQAAAVQDPFGAPFDEGPFMIVEVSRIGFELAGFLPDMDGDRLHALVEQTNQFGIPARPDFSSHIFRWHRIISFIDFHVAIAMHFARRFAEDRKEAG